MFDDDELGGLLERVRTRLPKAPNRQRYAMNGALIAIGGVRPALRATAQAVARHLGTVEVDHGETGCRTPDAREAIARVAAGPARRRKA